MTVIKNKGISAIYPLTDMQQAMLYHHMTNEEDEGFLVTECRLKGELSHHLFEKAWCIVAKRHEVLRNTVHWENLEKPFTVVMAEVKLDFIFLDWQNQSRDEQEKLLRESKNEIRSKPINFQKNPLSKVMLIKVDEAEHYMLWPSHHLLLDGWSGQIILTDVLNIYNSLKQGSAISLPPLLSFKSYFSWIQNQDPSEAMHFWKETFAHQQEPRLFSTAKTRSIVKPTRVFRKTLSSQSSKELNKKAKEFRITTSTLMQGLWGIALCLYFDSKDVVFGTTVSGRSVDIKNMHLMAGMFMNMQPIKISMDPGSHLKDYFTSLQQQRLKANLYDYLSLEEINNFIDRPNGRLLFDSLFIFENYPEVEKEQNGIKVIDLKSGLTTTYPITFAVVPGNQMELILTTKLDYNESSNESKLLEGIVQLVEEITTHEIDYLNDLPIFSNRKLFTNRLNVSLSKKSERGSNLDHIPPRNKVELELVEILEKTAGKGPIGVRDNFFELGINSFSAIRLFNAINKKFNTKHLPTTILEYPTVEAISELLSNGEGQKTTQWKNLVPISIKGSKKPLFCLHGAGGHVFYYNDLARNLAPERPVYALQPSGLFSGKVENRSVEQMAESYLSEIKDVSPHGPYNLLAYCFSTALGIEMSLKLKEMSEEVNLIILDSLVEQHSLKKGRFAMRFGGFIKRLLKNPLSAIKIYFLNRIEMFVTPAWQLMVASPEKKQLVRVKQQLIYAYKNYHWPSFDTPLKIILTDKGNKLFNEELINSWKSIYQGEIEILNTEGEHRYLLEEPIVKITAEKIDQSCRE